MLCAVGILVGTLSPWEARMGSTPFDWPRNVWPGGSEFARTLYRNGMRRTEGPFAQPICQGLYFAMLLPLALWMWDAGLVRRKGLVLAAAGAFAVGLFLSQSRGPLAGAVLACALTLAAWSRRRAILLTVFVVVGGIVLFASFETIRQHWFITRAEAVTEEQHSAAYRWEMLENYMEVVAERPWEGFGRNQIPVVKGQDSIDNQYLFLALTHGLPAAWAYLCALVAPVIALWSRLPRFRHDDRTARLGWAVASVLAMVAIVQVSVYAGTQTEQVMFLLEGLAVGLWIRLGEKRRGTGPRARTAGSGVASRVAVRDTRPAAVRRPVAV
jgi:O-antigen ligase